jgi:hypothetical protein
MLFGAGVYLIHRLGIKPFYFIMPLKGRRERIPI